MKSRLEDEIDTGSEIGDAPASPKLSKGEVTLRRIVQSAANVFAEKGYSSTTLSDIARAAGTQAGSLYYHFESREHIVRAVLRMSLAKVEGRVQEAVQELGDDASYADRIRCGARIHLRLFHSGDRYLAAYERIIREVPSHIATEISQFGLTYKLFWHDLIERAQKAGEIRSDLDTSVIRLLLFGQINWTRNWLNPEGKQSVDDIADHILTLFFEGARPQS